MRMRRWIRMKTRMRTRTRVRKTQKSVLYVGVEPGVGVEGVDSAHAARCSAVLTDVQVIL